MRIAFIGHDYHRKTGSSEFLSRLMQPLGEIERFSVDELGGGLYLRWRREFDPARYDVIVVWQVHFVLADLPSNHPNVVFVPMYDALVSGDGIHWDDAMSDRKTVCFSQALYRKIEPRGVTILPVTYFPDPAEYDAVRDFNTLRGFFWYRRREIPPDLIFRLIGASPFASVHLHNAPDPGHETAGSSPCPQNIGLLTVSTWMPESKDYQAHLRDCNIFFAPRLHEGIGMGLLDAMASGMCVVAPDRPTMNEYIVSKSNGLLYDPNVPVALDFDRAEELGRAAHRTVEAGFAEWQRQVPKLLDFILTSRAQGPARIKAPLATSPRSRAVGMLNMLKRRWPFLGRLIGSGLASAARLFDRGRSR